MTANVRFVFDNAADRATLAASSTAGSLAATNLQSDETAAVWRSVAGVISATLTLTWTNPEEVDSVALAWTNFSPYATVRVRAWTWATDPVGSTLVDTTVTPDTRDAALNAKGEVTNGATRAGVPQSASVWIAAAVMARKMIITLTDLSSADFYLEASRLIVGKRFEPAYNAEVGLQVTIQDPTEVTRAESRDLRVEPLGSNRSISFDLGMINTAADRNMLANMAQKGLGSGVWLSVFPDWTDASDQQLGAFYAGLVRESAFAYDQMYNWSESLTFEEKGAADGVTAEHYTSFELAGQTTLVPEYAATVAGAVPTSSRALEAYQTDFEGLLHLVPSGATRQQGARYERNLILSTVPNTFSTDWTGTATVTAGVSDPNGGTTAFTLTSAGNQERYIDSTVGVAVLSAVGMQLRNSIYIKRRTGTGNILMYNGADAAAYTNITSLVTTSWLRLTTAPQTIATAGQNRIGIFITSAGDAVDVWRPQVQDVVGRTNQAPSEWLDWTVTHGANVAGVKYFNTLNGNTVASNVVTEATGALITSAAAEAAGGVTAGVVNAGGPVGLLTEAAGTNLALQSNAFTTTWAQNQTPVITQDVVGPDGLTSAWTIQDNNATGSEYIYQTVALTAATYTMSVLVKKQASITADGYPVIFANAATLIAGATIDPVNGTATVWTSYTGLTVQASSATARTFNADYWLVTLSFTATVANWDLMVAPALRATANSATGTNNSALQGAVVFWNANIVLGSIASSYTPTTTVAVTRPASVAQYVSAGNLSATAMTIAMEITPSTTLDSSNTLYHFATYVDANNQTILISQSNVIQAFKLIGGVYHSNAIAWTRPVGVTAKMVARWDTVNGIDIWLNGVKGTNDPTLTASQIGTNFQIGGDGNGGNQDYCAHRFFAAHARGLPDAECLALST
ncbi:MAG: phage head spike fiber domain-containing protein [Burkholderiales bacterium]